MKFAIASAAIVASAAAASSVSYEVETVTRNTTTEVTVTSCSLHACETTVKPVVETTITTTVDGVATVYTTVCPVTETVVTTTVKGVETVYTTVCPVTETSSVAATPATSSKPTLLEAKKSVVSSELDIYVDLTTTPVVVTSTGVQATVTKQSTFVSLYAGASSVANITTFAGGANVNAVGAAGLVGVVALLL